MTHALKKVALFVPSLRGGGAERVMVDIARGFARKGLSVDLVLAQREGPYLNQVPQAVNVVDLKAHRVLASLPGLMSYLRNERPQAMLSTMTHANVVALLAKSLSRVPIRLVVREANTFSRSVQPSSRLGSKFAPRLIRYFYRRADSVVAVSEGVANDLALATGLLRNNIQVLYNPVIKPEVFELAKKPSGHSWLDDEAVSVVLGVGRLVKQKDFSTLIRAFSMARKKHPARLVILGEGDQRADLERQAHEMGLEDVIDFPGFVENPFAYMARSAVFVLSSAWEGLPNTLIQALALGVPVISTDCPSGPQEILNGGRFGTLVPVGDVERMGNAILAVLQGDSCQPQSADAWQRFSEDSVIEAYLKLMGGHRA